MHPNQYATIESLQKKVNSLDQDLLRTELRLELAVTKDDEVDAVECNLEIQTLLRKKEWFSNQIQKRNFISSHLS